MSFARLINCYLNTTTHNPVISLFSYILVSYYKYTVIEKHILSNEVLSKSQTNHKPCIKCKFYDSIYVNFTSLQWYSHKAYVKFLTTITRVIKYGSAQSQSSLKILDWHERNSIYM